MPVESLSDALKRFATSGFHHDFRVDHGKLRDLATGEAYDPEVLEIDETVRFEGESDPDEQAVLFALRSPRGSPLGTYSTVFGPAMPPDEVDVVRRLGAKS